MNRDQDLLIDTYRGFDVYYIEEDDKFVCEMVMEDSHKTTKRSSLKSLKQEIDAFIKANASFKPFKIMHVEHGYGESDNKEFSGNVKVWNAISVRKDGALVIEKEDGRKDYVKYGSKEDSWKRREAASLRIYNEKLFDIQKEWEEHESIWEAKKKELKAKAKPFIKTIDWTYVNSFAAKNYKASE
jgi:hypothetical protein